MANIEVEKIIEPVSASDGAGVKLKRSIGTHLIDYHDPFLMLDEFGSENKDDYIGGFPPHPHRGIETVTYMLAGDFEHKDSTGGEGIMTAGDVQWMKTGSGIIHSEMPAMKEGKLHGFQLWVNMPAKLKMTKPEYIYIDADKMSTHKDDDKTVKVIAGKFQDAEGPVKGHNVEPVYFDVELEKGKEFNFDLPSTHNSLVYLIEGEIKIGNQEHDAIKDSISNFPLYQGSLVARDNTVTLIVAELLDETKSEQTYANFMKIAEQANLTNGEEIHVAGEGAIAGYLGAYIDNDAKKLNPLAGLVITIILFIAYRTLFGMLLPNIIVGATVASAVGVMAANGIAFFVVTNALIVILIGIAVADSIHIFSQYYEEKSKNIGAEQRVIVVRAMNEIWRPITLTTMTTVAGFLGLYFASEMPPFRYLGLFSALGVIVAWFYSLTFLPAALSLLKI